MDTSYFVDYRYAKKLAEPLSINLFKINQGISEISFYLVYQKKKSVPTSLIVLGLIFWFRDELLRLT